jgi:hypothetical protein
VLRGLSANLFLLFLEVVGFEEDKPLESVLFVAADARNSSLEVLVAPVGPAILASSLRLEFVQSATQNADGHSPAGEDEIGQSKTLLQQIFLCSQKAPPRTALRPGF